MNTLFLFRDQVAEKLDEICDEGTEIDMGRSSGPVDVADIWVTVDGIDYHVQIEPMNAGDEQ